jgi:large subunit ribosomal protein L23Ae
MPSKKTPAPAPEAAKATSAAKATPKGKPAGNAASKAKKAADAVKKGLRSKKPTKVRLNTSFHRPKTLALPRKPQYPRKSRPSDPRLDQFQIIK